MNVARDRTRVGGVALALLATSAASCAHEAKHTPAGGASTVIDATRDAFSLPSPNLSVEHRASFFVGNSYFNDNWVAAPGSVDTRDGLGPLFNARSCSGCHFKDGRGHPPDPGQPMSAMLLRISVPGRGPHGAPVPDAVYGDQIQGSALPGVPREADVLVDYRSQVMLLGDDETLELRAPRYRLEHLGYGPTSHDLLTSPRVAPAMIGLGLLESVPEATLRKLADPDDRDQDGISGRLNIVWDAEKQATSLGRFGWKAEQPTVLTQSAGAFAGDMGITSSPFLGDVCTEQQTGCRAAPNGGAPEVSDAILKTVATYARSLAVPERRGAEEPNVLRGERVFEDMGCASCHRPTLETGRDAVLPELANQVIHPYTDLLLHDMGEALEDGRPTFEASGREWRTAPLWGLGLIEKVNGHTFLLHDGRARSIAEAVLWHAGEARPARDAFAKMSRGDRLSLLDFLRSL